MLLLAFAGSADAHDDVPVVMARLVDSATHPYLDPARFAARQADVRRLYESVAFQPIWVRDGEPTAQASRTIATLSDAETRGLYTADYDPYRLRAETARLTAMRHPSADDVALFDTALTIALMRFASDAHAGRISPARIGLALEVEAKQLDLPALVADIARSDDPARDLAALDPLVPTFARLRGALAAMRALVARTGLPPIPDDVPTLRPGDRHRTVPAIRERLAALGDIPNTPSPPADETLYDRHLAEAVQRFQERHGRNTDGVLGPVTLRDLRVSLGARMQQIELAMERMRWAPREVAGRFVVVNIPEFRLRGFDENAPTPAVSMKVVVGSAARRTETPIVHGHMRWVVFRPYWEVPASIARTEILPRAARDPGYLAREHMVLVDGRLRQRPGPNNALGLIKFVFPNAFDVYLHDTPQKDYFARSRRDFSHGCMRVADPVGLAEFVLGWERARITAAMTDGPDNRWVDVPDRTAVYVLYTTVAVEDGRIFFFDDIYGHDATLARALAVRYGERPS